MVTPDPTEARIPDFSPNMWKNGFTIRYRSPGSSPAIPSQSLLTHSVRPCVWTTPLGVPVVPEVNRMSDGSSGRTAAARRPTSSRATGSSAPFEVLPTDGRCPSRAVSNHDRLEVRKIHSRPVEQRHVVDSEKVGDGDEDAGVAAGQDVTRLGAFEPGVDRDQRPANLPDAQGGDDPPHAVEGPDRHPVSGINPRRHQGRRESPGLVDELDVSEPGVTVDDRQPIPEPGCVRGHLRDGPPPHGARRHGHRAPIVVAAPTGA